MKSVLKRSLFIAISLGLAALTARRIRQEREIEGSLDTPSPALPPVQKDARAISPAAPTAASPAPAADSIESVSPALAEEPVIPHVPLTAAPTVTFSGTVVRRGSHFALRETAGVLYPLDSAGRAYPFEGEDVRVTGKLDLNTQLLYVDAIERFMPSVL